MHRLLTLFVLTAAIAAAAAGRDAGDFSADAVPVASPLTREQLLASLTRDLSAHFNLEGDLQLELIRDWAPPARVSSAWQITVLEYPSVPSSSMLVRCRISSGSATLAENTFVLRAALYRDAWATRQPLTIGQTFDVAMLEARQVDLFRERDVLPAAVGDRSFIFARGVQSGRLLTWHDIARRPLVKKGELVEVSAADGMLSITMKALAMENGAQGDTVTVRNPESQKNFAAVVVDENHVQVRF